MDNFSKSENDHKAMNSFRRVFKKARRMSVDSGPPAKLPDARNITPRASPNIKTTFIAEVNVNESAVMHPEPTEYLSKAHRGWSLEEEKIVLGPYDYLAAQPGKDIRGNVMSAFNIWLGVPESSLEVIKYIISLLHNASLLIDDVEDNSDLRRGIPAAHKIFGVAQTINCSNYVYFLALKKLQELRNPAEALIHFTDELLNLHRGQGMDIFWRETLTTPSLADYIQMSSNKTGGLFRLAISLMQSESESRLNCIPLANILGLLFQIRDDYANLQLGQYTKTKGFCEDLSEGKFSFPITHAILSEPGKSPLLQVLRQRPTDEKVKLYAVQYMKEKTGSFEYTKMILAELDVISRSLALELGENRIFEALLDRLVVE